MGPFHIMAKPAGPLCNLDCRYCFYLEKETLYPGATNYRMSEAVLESFIRQYIEVQPTSVVTFAWQGGEPTLLGVEYFRRIIELQKRYAGGKRIENAFQTNGVLLNDAWAEFFQENSVLVGISVDGPEEIHDAYRVDKAGKPTFDRVMRGIDFLKKHGVMFNTLTTVHRANSEYPLQVYRFLKEHGSGYMQFIPVVERIASTAPGSGPSLVSHSFSGSACVAPWSVDGRQFGQFLCAIFDEWVRADVGKHFIQMFDVALQVWAGLDAGLCTFRRTCGSELAMEHSGDVYSCDHFVYPENLLGNPGQDSLLSIAHSEKQQQFGDAKETMLPKQCLECHFRFACNGGCPKQRFLKTPSGEAGLNYLCSGYKTFFRHIDPNMKFMARELHAERAPANIMRHLATLELQEAFAAAKPNDSCPCGSGKKYKRCCRNKA